VALEALPIRRLSDKENAIIVLETKSLVIEGCSTSARISVTIDFLVASFFFSCLTFRH